MSSIGSTYAQGLYALAKEENLTSQILEQLNTLQTVFSQTPDYLRLLSSASVPKQERCQVIDSSFRDRVHPYVLNFMKILTEKGYIRHFSQCCSHFKNLYNDDNGVLEVCAVTAVELTPEQKQKLSEKLGRITGKTIELNNKINPDVLGGVRLDWGGRSVDGTVKNRLEAIEALLKNTVL